MFTRVNFSTGGGNKWDLSELPGQKWLKVHTYELSLLVQSGHGKVAYGAGLSADFLEVADGFF